MSKSSWNLQHLNCFESYLDDCGFTWTKVYWSASTRLFLTASKHLRSCSLVRSPFPKYFVLLPRINTSLLIVKQVFLPLLQNIVSRMFYHPLIINKFLLINKLSSLLLQNIPSRLLSLLPIINTLMLIVKLLSHLCLHAKMICMLILKIRNLPHV